MAEGRGTGVFIYFSFFFLSFISCFVGEHFSKTGNSKWLTRIFLALAVLVVSLLAGVRDLNVGTDIWTYGEWLFRAAARHPQFRVFIKGNTDIDILYLVLTFLSGKFFSDSHWLYFFTGLLIYGFMLAGLWRYRRKISVSYAWLLYLLTFYGDTLNAMRQCIAVSISFLALGLAFDKQYKKFVISIVVAILFHNSAIIALGIFVIWQFLNNHDSILSKMAIVVGSLGILLYYGQIIQILVSLRILNDRFSRYTTRGVGFQLNPILIRIPFIIIIMIFFHQFVMYKRKDADALDSRREGDFLVIMLILELLTAEMRAFISTFYRMSFYFGTYKMVAYSRMIKPFMGRGENSRLTRMLVYILVAVFLMVLWYYQNVVQGNNDIYPYTSTILGIK